MILYNVTVGIDLDVEEEWLQYMKEVHIPKVLATGLFESYKMFKVLNHEDDSSSSYSIQYFSEDLSDVVKYLNDFAPTLAEEHRNRYLNKHVAFRTMLQQIA